MRQQQTSWSAILFATNFETRQYDSVVDSAQLRHPQVQQSIVGPRDWATAAVDNGPLPLDRGVIGNDRQLRTTAQDIHFEQDETAVNDTPTDRVAHDSPAVVVRPSPTPPSPGQNDLVHARVPLEFIRDAIDVIAETPQHTYQILTKRSLRLRRVADKLDWPTNLWMGVSVESTDVLNRVDHLREVPAAVRFLSCEPLLGPLDDINLDGISWVIVGGESGPNYRPMQISWARGIRDACSEAHVAFFFNSGVAGHARRLAVNWMANCGTKCQGPLHRKSKVTAGPNCRLPAGRCTTIRQP